MKTLLYLAGLLIFGFYTDLSSTDYFYGAVCPALTGLFAIILMVKVALLIGKSASGRSGGDGDGSGFFDGSGGGDCGGDGGGC
ncbi:hypothetical protein [Alteromonas facilis]|uniref:hypothetical protein n=1 Tax=Alteromonas facilis TaxID=2048004 RepID=UPI00196A98E3|nr:hypothetical protein [Alteromonas facilis]